MNYHFLETYFHIDKFHSLSASNQSSNQKLNFWSRRNYFFNELQCEESNLHKFCLFFLLNSFPCIECAIHGAFPCNYKRREENKILNFVYKLGSNVNIIFFTFQAMFWQTVSTQFNLIVYSEYSRNLKYSKIWSKSQYSLECLS